MNGIRFFLAIIISVYSIMYSPAGLVKAQDIVIGTFAEEIDNHFNDKIPANGPGAAVFVVKDGKVILRKGYGLANIELSVPIKPETVFRIGSITKQFTAACIMMLVDENKISLDDEITQFIPDYPTRGNRITIHNLLNHTSGIKSYDETQDFYLKIHNDLSPDEVVNLFKDEPLDFRPGEQFKYNNSGYFLLGIIIDTVSGSSYEEFVNERIFEPLGIKNSYHGNHSSIIPNRAAGYEPYDTGFVNADYLSMTQITANGSLLSSVDDLWIWTEALLSGEVVTQKSLNLMITPTKYGNGKTENYGYGFWLKPLFGERTISHNGGINGFLTYSLYVPEKNIFVAVLTNALIIVDAPFMGKWAAALLCGKDVKRKKTTILDNKTLDEIVGVYEISDGIYRTITRDGNRIYSQKTDSQKLEVFASSVNEFFFENSFNHFTVVRDKNGHLKKMVMHGPGPDVEAIKTNRKPKERKSFNVSPDDFEVFVGLYESEDGIEITITQKDEKFYAQLSGQPTFEILPENKNTFFFTVAEATLVFEYDFYSIVSGLTLSQGGRSLSMLRK